MPLVAPSAELIKTYLSQEITVKQFFRKYRSEMKETAPKHVIELLAAMSIKTPIFLGCFCEDESHCHRVVLRELILEVVEDLPPEVRAHDHCVSPPCSMPDPMADE
jgi:uncharacterized protein YeaO (DUF488 family)